MVDAGRIVVGVVAKRNVRDPVIGDAGQIGCRKKLVDGGRRPANETRGDDVVGKLRTAGAVWIAGKWIVESDPGNRTKVPV